MLCAEGAPRLALIDWMMPGLDGPSVCREVRKRQDGSYAYIMLLTSKQLSEDVVNGLQAGADDYLTKPCNPAELEARLRSGQRILRLEDNLVKAREDMRQKATHDELTTLWNRSAILALLKSEISRSVRDHSPLSLLLVDIDHFKRVNDSCGHLVGDEVLREVSARLRLAVRGHDVVGRYGGEEFLILLSGCDNHNLRQRAEQVRRKVSEHAFATAAGPTSVSISAGAITIAPWEGPTQPEVYLKQVDDALYRAKAAGRDRVEYVGDTICGSLQTFRNASRNSSQIVTCIDDLE
jgi:diguanylate cyclase (GGDEF)-like protein